MANPTNISGPSYDPNLLRALHAMLRLLRGLCAGVSDPYLMQYTHAECQLIERTLDALKQPNQGDSP